MKGLWKMGQRKDTLRYEYGALLCPRPTDKFTVLHQHENSTVLA